MQKNKNKESNTEIHSSSLLTLARSVFIFLGVGIFGYIFAFLTKIVAARYFGPEQLGALELVTTVIGIATMICTLGISSSLPKYIPTYETKKQFGLLNGFIRYALFAPTIMGIIVGALLFIYAPQITSYLNASNLFLTLLRIVSLALPLKMLGDSLSGIFQAKKESFYAAIGHNVIEKIILLISVIIASITAQSIVLYAYGLVFSIAAILIINIIIYFKKISFKFSTPQYKTKMWTTFSVPLLFFGVTSFILAWTDNFVISKFLDQGSLGTYGIAFSLASYLTFIPALFLPLFLPIMVEMHIKKTGAFATFYERASVWSYTTALYFGTVFLFFPTQIISILFGPAYISGASSLLILTISFVITSYFVFCYSLLILKGNTIFIFINTGIVAILNLAANILLLTHVSKSITMVAYSTAISFALVKVSEFILVRKHFKPNIPIGHLIKVTICALVSGALVKVLFIGVFNQGNLPQFIRLIIAGVGYTLVFVLTLIISKAITTDDKLVINAVLAKAKVSPKIISLIARIVSKFA